MLINVPQYIDVEDKIAGPLTAKQLGWMIAMGVTLLILWNVVPTPVFFIIGIPFSLLMVGFAFYRPYGQPLGSFVIFGALYFFRPKVYIWKRMPQKEIKEAPKVKVVNPVFEKQISADSLRDLAQLLDSEGMEHSEGVEQILKQLPTKKS